MYFKQPQHQYLEQSLLEYWVHTLSRVLSVNPAPAVSLHIALWAWMVVFSKSVVLTLRR